MTTTLLAGPILRRVTPNRVCVWVATQEKPETLKLEVVSSKNEVLGESKTDDLPLPYFQIGKKLFVCLLQARAKLETGYPLDTLLYYRLLETSDNGDDVPWDLSALAYGGKRDLKLPSFFIPVKLKKLLHGSCRQPHGGYDSSDALSHGDDLLAETYSDLNQRPALLLLTGDQIYADDVSISVLSMLRKQAAELIGKQELLPVVNPGKELTSINPHTEPLYSRMNLLKYYKSGFSSGAAQNHLLSFGEFAAMYIYVFGNVANWKPEDNWDQLAKEDIADIEKAERAFAEQQAPVKNFHSTLGKVRKLLANIPTYMIFDDHDVTDDWNITNNWYDNVRNSVLGRRVVSNALASYLAFQGWGNDPDNFDKDLQWTVTQYLLNGDEDPAKTAEIGERYDLHTWKHRGWSFSVPTVPPIIAIDSRTQRTSTTDSYLPSLVDRYACDWLKVEWIKLTTDLNATATNISPEIYPIFIAATPVMGFAILEKTQKLLYRFAEYFEHNTYVNYIEDFFGMKGFLAQKVIDLADIEAWTSNKTSLEYLVQCLREDMHIEQCVFLSGDVHYAFTAIGKHSKNAKDFLCYQLVSSSLKDSPNAKQDKTFKIAEKFNESITDHTTWFKKMLAWLAINKSQTLVHLLAPEDTKYRVHRECNLGLVTFDGGRPAQHILLQDKNRVVWTLQPSDFKRFDSCKVTSIFQTFREK
ncbi:MAG: hypothetical protein PHO08_14595 [Methylococcales bacterium]|nr:hypothetical protein [Methylococcales bacterium]